MHPRVILALKSLIAVLLALLLVSQVVMMPAVAAETARRNPGLAFLEVPGLVGAVLFLVLVQIVLVCIWRLLSLVRGERIFSPRAFVYVDVIIAAMVAAALLIAASFVILVLTNASSPSIVILATLGITVGIALALLVVVLRGLLRKALELEQDLAEVV